MYGNIFLHLGKAIFEDTLKCIAHSHSATLALNFHLPECTLCPVIVQKVRWWMPTANKPFNLCIELKRTFSALALDIRFINNYCNHHITRHCRQMSALGYSLQSTVKRHFRYVTVQQAEEEWPPPTAKRKEGLETTGHSPGKAE